MGIIQRSFTLFKASWQVISHNKKLLLLPIISGLCCLILFILFSIPFLMAALTPRVTNWVEIALWLIYYIIAFFLMTFFNAAFMFCADTALRGEKPSLKNGIKRAYDRIGSIFLWSLVAASVGWLIRILEDRSGLVGTIIYAILGCAWSVITYFALPVLVFEDKNPFSAIRDSIGILKKSWGEGFVLNSGMGLLYLALLLPAFAVIAAGFAYSIFSLILIAIIYVITLLFMASAMAKVFEVALYRYAKTGDVPNGFSDAALRGAFKRKRKLRL